MANPVGKGLLIDVGLNDANFATGMKGITQQLKQAQNEFRNINAIIGKNENSIKSLNAKYQASAKVVEAQKRKVEELKKRYEQNKLAIENNEKATQKDRDALLRSGQAYNNAVGQLAKYEQQMDSLKKKVIDTGGYVGKLGANLQNLGSGLKNVGDKVSSVGSTMTSFVSVPIAGALATASKKALDFNDEMTKMKAVSGASKKDMEALKNASLEASKSYGISTKSYNDSATELLKSGYSAKESMSIMNAGIKTSKATGEELETVLDKTSNTMKIFGYGAKDASTVTDKLAYVANASKTSVSELGDGLTKVGPVAKNLGIDLDTTASALGVLQDRGFKVEEASTGLRSGLSNLIYPTAANTEAFQKLGVNLADVEKNGVNLPKILQDMNKATQGMTQSQKEALISQAFGKEAMSQWTELMSGPAQQALNKYTKGSKNAKGQVDKLWKTMKKSPKQQIDELKGSFNALAINIGDKVLPVVLPVLKDITKQVNKMVDWFGSLNKTQQENIVKFTMLVGAMGPVALVGGKIIKVFGSLVGGIGKTVKGFGSLISKTNLFVKSTIKGENWLGKFSIKLGGLAKKGASNGLDAIKRGMNNIGEASKKAISKVGDLAKKIGSLAGDTAKKGLSAVQNGLSKIKEKGSEAGKKIGDISSKIGSWAGDKVKAGMSALRSGLDKVKTKASEASSKVANITKTAIENTKAKGNGKFFSGLLKSITDVASKSKIGQLAIKGLSSAFSLMTGPVGIAVGAIALIGTAFVSAYKHCKPFRDFINNIGKWFKEKFDGAIKWTKQFAGKFKDWIVNKSINPVSIAVKGWKVASYFGSRFKESMKKTGSFSASFKSAFNDTVKKVSNTVMNWPIVKKFSDKWNSIKSSVSEFVKDLKEKISGLVKKIADTVANSSIAKAFTNIFKSAWNGVAGVLQKLANGSAWVLDQLGADGMAKSLRGWGSNLKKYKNGTDGHKGGHALVNDGYGPNYREALLFPNGQITIPQGRNVFVPNMPAGTQVLDGRSTAQAMKSGQLRKYKDGTGGFWSDALDFGKDLVKNTANKIKDVVGDVMDFMDKPKELVDKVIESFVGNFGGKGFGFESAKGAVRLAKNALLDRVKELFASMDTGGEGGHGDLGSNNWFKIDGNWVREWQYRLLEPIIKKYHFIVTDGGRRTWDNFDHSKGRAMDIAIPGNPLGIYWKVAQQIDKMPFVKYVNSNMKSTINGKWEPSTLEPRADHIHVSFTKELLTAKELKATGGVSGAGNPGGAGVNRWIPLIKKAAKQMKVHLTPAGLNAVLRRIRQESNGDPNVVNNWDSNAQAGHPSKGLLQYIQPTLDAWVPPGVKPDLSNGYTQLLALFNDSNWLADISVPGGWGPTGHKRFEKGGLITSHMFAEMGEGGKPEMVIPLTDKSRSVQLINKARKLIGEDEIYTDTKALEQQNQELIGMNEKLGQMIDLLSMLLSKDTNLYIDDKEIAKAIAQPMQQEINRQTANKNRLYGLI